MRLPSSVVHEITTVPDVIRVNPWAAIGIKVISGDLACRPHELGTIVMSVLDLLVVPELFLVWSIEMGVRPSFRFFSG